MAEKEYIERELAEKTIDRFEGYLDDDMIFRIKYALRKHIPAADVVPVVRCKDCRFHEMCCRNIRSGGNKPDDFCSYGERKNGGEGE